MNAIPLELYDLRAGLQQTFNYLSYMMIICICVSMEMCLEDVYVPTTTTVIVLLSPRDSGVDSRRCLRHRRESRALLRPPSPPRKSKERKRGRNREQNVRLGTVVQRMQCKYQ